MSVIEPSSKSFSIGSSDDAKGRENLQNSHLADQVHSSRSRAKTCGRRHGNAKPAGLHQPKKSSSRTGPETGRKIIGDVYQLFCSAKCHAGANERDGRRNACWVETWRLVHPDAAISTKRLQNALRNGFDPKQSPEARLQRLDTQKRATMRYTKTEIKDKAFLLLRHCVIVKRSKWILSRFNWT